MLLSICIVFRSGEINEDEKPGLHVVQVSANDKDNTYENKKVEYSIVSGNNDRKFEMVSSTGQIVLLEEIDREVTQSYVLIVKVIRTFSLKLTS